MPAAVGSTILHLCGNQIDVLDIHHAICDQTHHVSLATQLEVAQTVLLILPETNIPVTAKSVETMAVMLDVDMLS